jgi:hypothetical protein
MIWFNIKELELKLKGGEMSDKDFFQYLLANMILYSVVPYLSDSSSTKWILAIEIVFALAITVIGTKMTFDINSRGDNKDYFKRFFALSLVVAIRLIVFTFIALVPVVVIARIANSFGTVEGLDDFYNLALTIIFSLAYYYMLTRSFERVSKVS